MALDDATPQHDTYDMIGAQIFFAKPRITSIYENVNGAESGNPTTYDS